MIKNQLGKSDLFISELTLGCMSLGTNKTLAGKIIDRAIDAGVNHFDTADLYDFGVNEEIVGAAIKSRRKDIVLTTKVGNHFNLDKKTWFWDPSKKHIKNGVKESLRRLNTDYIDLYMLHGGTIEDPIDESIAAFDELKKEGIVRAYGISSIRPNVIREYVKRSNIDAVMLQYNMLDRRPEEVILDYLHESRVSVLARGPLAKGILSGNFTTKHIKTKAIDGYLDYTFEDLNTIFSLLDNLGRETSLHTLALKYVLKHPAVATAVFGASSVDQVKENTVLDHSTALPTDVYTTLQKITKPIRYTNHR